MNEHCPVLRRLAAQCQHVTEFGVRGGVSTVALLAGIAEAGGVLRSYDNNPCKGVAERIGALAPGHFQFIVGSSLEVTIEPTDLLMIDTVHTGNHLFRELTRHQEKVGRWIVMHDTVEYGWHGDDGGEGLYSALGRFLLEFPWWRVQEHHTNLHGLTVLVRG